MDNKIDIIVLGTSAGGIDALKSVLGSLDDDFSIPILVVIHMAPETGEELPDIMSQFCSLKICYPTDKEAIRKGYIYIAPPNYHMLVDSGSIISLNIDKKVNYCRPSIDVLFESAAYVFGNNAAGILLTGSNSDGACGLLEIRKKGGLAVIEDPDTAFAHQMPQSGLDLLDPDFKGSLKEISEYINMIGKGR